VSRSPAIDDFLCGNATADSVQKTFIVDLNCHVGILDTVKQDDLSLLKTRISMASVFKQKAAHFISILGSFF